MHISGWKGCEENSPSTWLIRVRFIFATGHDCLDGLLAFSVIETGTMHICSQVNGSTLHKYSSRTLFQPLRNSPHFSALLSFYLALSHFEPACKIRRSYQKQSFRAQNTSKKIELQETKAQIHQGLFEFPQIGKKRKKKTSRIFGFFSLFLSFHWLYFFSNFSLHHENRHSFSVAIKITSIMKQMRNRLAHKNRQSPFGDFRSFLFLLSKTN